MYDMRGDKSLPIRLVPLTPLVFLEKVSWDLKRKEDASFFLLVGAVG